MSTFWSNGRRRLSLLAALGLVAVAVLAGPPAPPAGAIIDPLQPATQGLDDVDARLGSVPPTSAQRSAASGLGATVRWNRFGTPQSVTRYGGFLATGLSNDPATAARAW